MAAIVLERELRGVDADHDQSMGLASGSGKLNGRNCLPVGLAGGAGRFSGELGATDIPPSPGDNETIEADRDVDPGPGAERSRTRRF